MTVRRLAAAILARAVRHAGLQHQEWGKAILRELDFVENDWAALRWAISLFLSLDLADKYKRQIHEIDAQQERLP